MIPSRRATLSYPYIEERPVLELRDDRSADVIHIEDAENPVELRSEEQREIYGRIIPYGEQIMVRGRPESFTRGAVAHIRPEQVRLLAYHDSRRPIGIATRIEERDDGAYAVVKVSRTPLGDEMLELARDGVLSFSPGFVPDVQKRDGTHTRIKALPEVSLVTFAAYTGARVLAVRDEEGTTEPEPVDLGPIETRLDNIDEMLQRFASIADAPRVTRREAMEGLRPIDWFVAQLDAEAGRTERREQMEEAFAELQRRVADGEIETRLLEDITGEFPEAVPADDISGLVVEEFIASQLVNVLDTRRPLSRRLGSFPMPRSGYAKIPVVTQHTEVAERAGQKQEANSRKMIVTTKPFEAQWYDGAVDIALEVIRSAEIGVVDMVWNDLLGQYAIAVEAGNVATIEAGGLGFGYTGSALRTDTYAHFITDVATEAITVEENSGAPATLVAVTKAQWIALLAMVDSTGRRQFAPLGPSNSDATTGINSRSIVLPDGIEVFYTPGLTAALVTNGESLRFSDGGPERVEATNVAKMGRDLGLLGRAMFVPRIPAGVRVFGADPES